jgi:hypothetical protein
LPQVRSILVVDWGVDQRLSGLKVEVAEARAIESLGREEVVKGDTLMGILLLTIQEGRDLRVPRMIMKLRFILYVGGKVGVVDFATT